MKEKFYSLAGQKKENHALSLNKRNITKGKFFQIHIFFSKLINKKRLCLFWFKSKLINVSRNLSGKIQSGLAIINFILASL